ncbi:hypothetical protein L0F63_002388, partial [Massospora cicadina]
LVPLLGPTLVALDLGFCKGLKNYDLQRFLPSLSNITSLNLAGGNRSDIVLTKLVKHCPGLVRLSLSWNSHLTDFGFIELARQCPQLQYLDLTNCAQISDYAVTAFSSHCRCSSVSKGFGLDASRVFPLVSYNVVGFLPFYYYPPRRCIRD